MAINHRKFQSAIITLGGTTDYSAQVLSTTPQNNTGEGEKVFTFEAAGPGEFVEPDDADWQVTIKALADWTTTGISRYIAAHDGEEQELTINFDNAVTGWDRTWTGTVTIRQPGDGGDARARQEFEVTWKYIGKPALTYAP